MTPAAARAMYRRQLKTHGEPITIHRGEASAVALGKVKSYRADEITPGVSQGDHQVIVLAEDLERAGFPVPPTAGDEVVWLGRALYVMPTPTQRRVGTTTVAFEMVARG